MEEHITSKESADSIRKVSSETAASELADLAFQEVPAASTVNHDLMVFSDDEHEDAEGWSEFQPEESIQHVGRFQCSECGEFITMNCLDEHMMECPKMPQAQSEER